MRRPAVFGRQVVRARLAPLVALLAAGCVTTYTPMDLGDQAAQLPVSLPVSIPILNEATGSNRLLMDFYTGILRRLQEAADDGDVELLESLVASYDQPNIPQSVAQHLTGYRAIGRGIRFRQHCVREASLGLRMPLAPAQETPASEPKVPALGADLQLELRVPAMARAVVLGGLRERDPIGFSVSVTVDDEYVDGSRRSLHTDGVVWLPESFQLDADRELILPIDVDAVAGDAVRRHVTIRVDMRGHIQMDGIRSPVKSTTIGAASYTQWPVGYEIIQDQPLRALQTGLADFQSTNFASVYLASLMIPENDRHLASAALMDQVRFGRADQSQVAMAALKQLTGLSIAIGDRDSWLFWWQSQAQVKTGAAAVSGR